MDKGNSRSSVGPFLRADIEERFRNNLNMTMFGANAMAAAILEVICRNLISGKTIEMRNVGKIESRYRAARRHHTLTKTPETRRTQSRMKRTPARRVLRFSPSQNLRTRMLKRYHDNDAE